MIELIDTTDGKFMSKNEAAHIMQGVYTTCGKEMR